MKQFFKMVFATMVGMFFFGILMTIIGVMCIMGMVASGSSAMSVPDNSVMVMKLTGSMDERQESNFLSEFMGETNESIGLDGVLESIRRAKDNEEVKGIYIEAGMFSSDSYASCSRAHLPEGRAEEVWRAHAAEQGGSLQECSRDVYFRPHER